MGKGVFEQHGIDLRSCIVSPKNSPIPRGTAMITEKGFFNASGAADFMRMHTACESAQPGNIQRREALVDMKGGQR